MCARGAGTSRRPNCIPPTDRAVAGAAGVGRAVDRSCAPTPTPLALLTQLRAIAGGGAPLTGLVARTVLDLLRETRARTGARGPHAPTRLDLTDREQEVLQCLVRGLSYKQAADRLGVSLDTIRTHVRAVYEKLQVHSVAEAVSRAIRDRLV